MRTSEHIITDPTYYLSYIQSPPWDLHNPWIPLSRFGGPNIFGISLHDNKLFYGCLVDNNTTQRQINESVRCLHYIQLRVQRRPVIYRINYLKKKNEYNSICILIIIIFRNNYFCTCVAHRPFIEWVKTQSDTKHNRFMAKYTANWLAVLDVQNLSAPAA